MYNTKSTTRPRKSSITHNNRYGPKNKIGNDQESFTSNMNSTTTTTTTQITRIIIISLLELKHTNITDYQSKRFTCGYLKYKKNWSKDTQEHPKFSPKSATKDMNILEQYSLEITTLQYWTNRKTNRHTKPHDLIKSTFRPIQMEMNHLQTTYQKPFNLHQHIYNILTKPTLSTDDNTRICWHQWQQHIPTTLISNTIYIRNYLNISCLSCSMNGYPISFIPNLTW